MQREIVWTRSLNFSDYQRGTLTVAAEAVPYGRLVFALKAFDKTLHAVQDYSNNIDRLCNSRTAGSGLHQSVANVMPSRRRYENGAIGPLTSKSRNVANGNVGSRREPSDGLANVLRGASEVDGRRQQQSCLSQKRESYVPKPKSVLYPALLQYIRSRVPKAAATVKKATTPDKRAAVETKCQHHQRRSMSQRAKRVQSNVEQVRHKSFPGERNVSEGLRGGSIERPLRRSRSVIGLRTKPPEPLSRWEMLEHGLVRKVNQIRASPKYKLSVEKSGKKMAPLNKTYTKSAAQISSPWKSFDFDRATLHFQQLVETKIALSHNMEWNNDSVSIQSIHSTHAGNSVEHNAGLQRNIIGVDVSLDYPLPNLYTQSLAEELEAYGVCGNADLNSKTDTGVQMIADKNRVDRSIGGSDSNGAVSENSSPSCRRASQAKSARNVSRTTSRTDNAKSPSSPDRDTRPARRSMGKREPVRRLLVVTKPSLISGESSSSGSPALSRSDFWLSSSRSSLQQDSSSKMTGAVNVDVGSSESYKFEKSAINSEKQSSVHHKADPSSGCHSLAVENPVSNFDWKHSERPREGQKSDGDSVFSKGAPLSGMSTSFISPQTLSSLYFSQTQELHCKGWSSPSRTDVVSKQVQRSLSTLDELMMNVERASKIFDSSFGARLSISACEQMADAVAKSKPLNHYYAVTPLAEAIVTPNRRNSDVSATRGQALVGRLNAHLAFNERIDHMDQQLRDTRDLLKMAVIRPTTTKTLSAKDASDGCETLNGASGDMVFSRENNDLRTGSLPYIEESTLENVSPRVYATSLSEIASKENVSFHFILISVYLVQWWRWSLRLRCLFYSRQRSFNLADMDGWDQMASPMKPMNVGQKFDDERKHRDEHGRCPSGKENEPLDGKTETFFTREGRSSITQPVKTEKRSGNEEAPSDKNALVSETVGTRKRTSWKDSISSRRGREELAEETIAALRQYYTDVCVFFYLRKKELMRADKFDEWQQLSKKQRSTENDILDMRRIYERSKRSDKPYVSFALLLTELPVIREVVAEHFYKDEYLQYHTHETARLHMLSLELREELFAMGQTDKDSIKRLGEARKNTEKILRLTTSGGMRRPKKTLERKEANAHRLRREQHSRMRAASLSKDGSSFAESDTGSASNASISLGNRGPVKLLGNTSATGLLGACEDRVNHLRDELRQKREEANVLKESFDRKIQGVDFDHNIRDLSAKAESSVLEQIKAHESYIKQTANHIAILERLETDQLSASSSSNPRPFLSPSVSQNGPTSLSATTNGTNNSYHLSSSLTHDAVVAELSSSATSWNESSLPQTSALVSERVYQLSQNLAKKSEDLVSEIVPGNGDENPMASSVDSIRSVTSNRTLVDSDGTQNSNVVDDITETSIKENTLDEVSTGQFVASPEPEILNENDSLNENLKWGSAENAFMGSQEAEQSDESEFQDTFEEFPIPLEPADQIVTKLEDLKRSQTEIVNEVSAVESKADSEGKISGAAFSTHNQETGSGELSGLLEKTASSEGEEIKYAIEAEPLEIFAEGSSPLEITEPGVTVDLLENEGGLSVSNTLAEEVAPENVLRPSTEPNNILDSLSSDDLESLEELEVTVEHAEISVHGPFVPKLDLNEIRDSDHDEAYQEVHEAISGRMLSKANVDGEGAGSGKASVSSERTVVESAITQSQIAPLSLKEVPKTDSLNSVYKSAAQPFNSRCTEEMRAHESLTAFTAVEASVKMPTDLGETEISKSGKTVADSTNVPAEVGEERSATYNAASEGEDSECFFAGDAPFFAGDAPSHESLASSRELKIQNMEVEPEQFKNDASVEGTLMEETASGKVEATSSYDITQWDITSDVQKSSISLAKSDVVIDVMESTIELPKLTRTPELVASEINDSAQSITVREKPKRFALSVSPLSNSPRSPLTTRFVTTMPSQNRSPRSLPSTPRSPRKGARVASPLGKLLLEESLNDSLAAMLSVAEAKRSSLGRVGRYSLSEEQNILNAELETKEMEGKSISKQWPDNSWLGDTTYDLNSIPEPKSLFNITPLDLSEMSASEEAKPETDAFESVVQRNQPPFGLPDLTVDTPVPKQNVSRMPLLADDLQKKFYSGNADDVRAIIAEYGERIWLMFNEGQELRIDVEENSVREHSARVAYKQMLADECCAVARKAFKRDLRSVWLNFGTAPPPKDVIELKAILRRDVFSVLYPDSSKAKAKSRWEVVCRDETLKSSSEMCALTKLVMDQLYRDQDRWRDFEPIEERIKEEMANDILKQQMTESFNAIRFPPDHDVL
ncbi:unnamed protein product [Toxocara canis]|uniref:Serine/arginine repetitive matrix protein 2 n=1 Tax=Toxocara canis TaxID=6265 RepID=A0A183UKL0_TOXCA|nr:unnamed protein product [Toxocara canis]